MALIDHHFTLFQLIDVSDDGYLSLMDDGGNTRDDLKIPEGDLGEEIKKANEDSKDILVRGKIDCCIEKSPRLALSLPVHCPVRLRRRGCHRHQGQHRR